ncbi:rod shape-determining protein MreC [Candidatus Uhrbacteria bacterium]|nr:rod shape-determining protein MreC [Candidatus Uhrbacteria bacterium]
MKSGITSNKRIRRFMFVVGLVLCIALFSFQGLFPRIFVPFAAPLVGMGTWVSQVVFWQTKDAQITPEELKDLFDDRRELSIDAQRMTELERENELLKQELGYVERTQTNALPTRVLSKSISHSVSRFVVDVGADDGVTIGLPVVSGEGIFVGKVVDVGRHSATVSALTDPTLTVAVSLLNESQTIGIATGSTGGLLQIDFIPTDEVVTENNLVVTSGLEASIPSGLLVGIVNSVEQQTGSPFQQAVVEPLADVRLLSSVLVLLTSEKAP